MNAVNDYLVPPAKFASLKQASELPLAVATDCNRYLNDRLTLLETQLATVNRMATANELPDAIITESGLKITPLDAAVPDTAQALIDQTAMILPHVKITERTKVSRPPKAGRLDCPVRPRSQNGKPQIDDERKP